MIISTLLDAKTDRRRELMVQDYEHGLNIEEKIELHELDEDIKVMKLLQLLTKPKKS